MQKLKERYLAAKQSLFMRVYTEFLNEEQASAVFTAKGPLLVLAGAGSGKTTVLVNRIAYLIKYGNAYHSDEVPEGLTEEAVLALEGAIDLSVEEISELLPGFISEPCPPWRILAFTFTNKAAGEIKDRINSTLDEEHLAASVTTGTFHSVCVRILRRFGDRVGYREGFSIYDTDDKKRMVTECMKALNIDEKVLSARVICDAISRAKDTLKGPDDMELERDPRRNKIIDVYRLYEKRMLEHNAVDFDDIIMRTVELLENDSEVRDYYQSRYEYVLVDEYQDTNYAQFRLVSLLADKKRNIMVVGDDDQSIYRFRGATVENILSFDRTYPDATVVKLEHNYRSTTTILDAANAVIRHNDERHEKNLWSNKGTGEKITLHEAENAEAEGRYIIDKIAQGVRVGGKKYSDFAILYRINALGRSLQTVFAKSGIPYKVIGDMRFYDRKEIRDMVAYLTLVASPDDNLRLKRVINEPKRKIGSATVDAIEAIANSEGLSMYRVMERSKDYVALEKNAAKLTAFTSMIDKVRTTVREPSRAIAELFDVSGYRTMLIAEGFEGQTKIENVEELISAAAEYEKKLAEGDTEPTVAGFLEEISLITDIDKYDETADAVVLMTIHAAKGLEFPTVFIAGAEEGIFPGQQNIGEPTEMNEERRLAYVAITRAKDKLFITYSKERMMYGKTVYGTLSRFVKMEIPPMLIASERPERVPPRTQPTYTPPRRDTRTHNLTEMRRSADLSIAPQPRVKKGAAGYGIIRFAPGTAVRHAMFGKGIILSAKDMGGDVLYEVRFDEVGIKKLMATYAKLEEYK